MAYFYVIYDDGSGQADPVVPGSGVIATAEMPYGDIHDLFIRVQTSGIDETTLQHTSTWSEDGRPAIRSLGQELLPEGVEIRTLLYPSGAGLTLSSVDHLLHKSRRDELTDYLDNSGYYFDIRRFEQSGVYDHTFNINRTDENTWYRFGYSMWFYNVNNILVYDQATRIDPAYILTRVGAPDPGNISVTSNLYSDTLNMSRLRIGTSHIRRINNGLLSTPAPYLITISGVDGYYSGSGILLSSGDYDSTNLFTHYQAESGLYIDLVYISGVDTNYYDIGLMYYNQLGLRSPSLIYQTKNIQLQSDIVGSDPQYITSIERSNEIPIKHDVISKKRLSINVEDIGLVNSTYIKQGEYISDYYTIDDPIYTCYVRVDEAMPDVPGVDEYDVIKYYMQFQNQDWIRISPINRGDEYDSDGVLVPKFFILDKLDIGHISTELTELPYDFPVYSIRIRIQIDMSTAETANFISPSVNLYEIHLTDRTSFIKV